MARLKPENKTKSLGIMLLLAVIGTPLSYLLLVTENTHLQTIGNILKAAGFVSIVLLAARGIRHFVSKNKKN